MTTEEIKDAIEEFRTSDPAILKLLGLLETMNGNIGALEKRLQQQDRELSRAANIASCLANGIQPD